MKKEISLKAVGLFVRHPERSEGSTLKNREARLQYSVPNL